MSREWEKFVNEPVLVPSLLPISLLTVGCSPHWSPLSNPHSSARHSEKLINSYFPIVTCFTLQTRQAGYDPGRKGSYCNLYIWPVTGWAGPGYYSSVFPNSALRLSRDTRPESAYFRRAPRTHEPPRRAHRYVQNAFLILFALLRQVVWPWLKSPDVSISRVREETRKIEVSILVKKSTGRIFLLNFCLVAYTIFSKSEIRQEILCSWLLGKSVVYKKKVSPSPVCGCPHHKTSMSTTARFKKIREKRKMRGTGPPLSRLNPWLQP